MFMAAFIAIQQSSMSEPKPFDVSGRTPTDFSGLWIRSLSKCLTQKYALTSYLVE